MLADDREPFRRRVPGVWNAAACLSAALLALAGLGAAAPPDEAFDGACKIVEKGTGRPIAGASVTVRRYLWPDPATGRNPILRETKHRTDEAGNIRYDVSAGEMAEPRLRLVLEIEHPGYAPELGYPDSPRVTRKNAALGDRSAQEFELSPGKPITGTVEAPDGKPAVGVKVKAVSYFAPGARPGSLVSASTSETQTDDQGRFRIVVITPGEATIELYPEHFAMSTRDVRDGARGDLGRFVLEEGVSVSGRVLDDEGKPLSNVIVNAAGSAHPPAEGSIEALLPGNDEFSRSTLTNAQGEFKLPPLPAGSYRVGPVEWDRDPLIGESTRPLPAPFAARKLVVKPGEPAAPLEFRPMESVAVEARILDSKGMPVDGTSLTLGGALPQEKKAAPQGDDALVLPSPGGEYWVGHGRPDATGKLVFRAPMGLTYAGINLNSFVSDEHHVFRHRIAKDAPLLDGPQVNLESLDHDVKGIEIVSYESPILLVKVVAVDGAPLHEVDVTAVYPAIRARTREEDLTGGLPPFSVRFYEQEDGRRRSTRLLPDEEVVVTARAGGYAPKSASFSLPEASTRSVELVLDEE